MPDYFSFKCGFDESNPYFPAGGLDKSSPYIRVIASDRKELGNPNLTPTINS